MHLFQPPLCCISPLEPSVMTRCDRENGVSHRVLFVTLLAIAVTFTVILTNVFVDIDGLVRSGINASKRNKEILKTEPPEPEGVTLDPQPEIFYIDDEDNFDDKEDAFRTRRSLESQTHHPKNSKMTKLLTHRLASLLEEIDSEDTTSTPTVATDKDTAANGIPVHTEDKEESETSLLRLAVHNLLLDGVANHIDFSDIYKEVQAFQRAIKKIYLEKQSPKREAPYSTSSPRPKVDLFNKESLEETDEEDKILYEELLKCSELKAAIKEQIENNSNKDTLLITDVNDSGHLKKGQKIVINTKINIETDDDDKNSFSKDNVAAIVHINHNGKPVSIDNNMSSLKKTEMRNNKENNINKTYAHSFLREYYKTFYHGSRPSYSEISKIETKRLKRHIKLRFMDQNDPDMGEYDKYDNKIVKKSGNADDELFVEIKTFFNNKTVKSDKKRKLIETLIEKIESAVHSDLPVNNDKHRKKVTFKHWNIKKRTQNPLKHHRFRTQDAPLHITSRLIKAIGDKPRSQEVTDIRGSNDYFRVKFDDANPVNSYNEPEYYEDDKYKNVAQRMQVPLNVNKDMSNETINDVHKLKFLIKNIDGSGFSIGFNQYSDQPPDPESIKLFTGLDHLIRTYHQQYDQIDDDKDIVNYGSYENYNNQNHIMAKRDADIISTSFHQNIAPSFRHIKPYNNLVDIWGNEVSSQNNNAENSNGESEISSIYLEIGKKPNQNASEDQTNAGNETSVKDPEKLINAAALLDKPLKPAEIFNLAEVFGRRKRSIDKNNVTLKEMILSHRIKNAKRREIKIKRQAPIQHHSEHLDYVDDIFGGPIAQTRSAYIDTDESTIVARQNDAFTRRNPLLPPILYQQNPTYHNYRKTVIMPMPDKASLYPHVFEQGDIQIDQDKAPEYFPINPNFSMDSIKDFDDKKDPTEAENSEIPNFKEIVGGYSDKNYKIRIKVLPKQTNKDGATNETKTTAAFKEVHTSINKSFDRDGKRISTILNISEISHVHDLNNSTNCSIGPDLGKNTPVATHIHVKQRSQDDMKNILTKHKNIIDKQLVNLEEEKKKIDDMLSSNAKLAQRLPEEENNMKHENTADSVDVTKSKGKSDELLEITLPFQPPKVLWLSKKQIGKILGDSLNILDDIKSYHNPKQVESKGNSYLENVIKENINLTHQIMRKIDRNTDMLEQFLQKLSNDKGTSLKRASINSVEMMKNGGNVVNIVKEQVKMLPLEVKLNGFPIAKTIEKARYSLNKEVAKPYAESRIFTNRWVLTKKVENNVKEAKKEILENATDVNQSTRHSYK